MLNSHEGLLYPRVIYNEHDFGLNLNNGRNVTNFTGEKIFC